MFKISSILLSCMLATSALGASSVPLPQKRPPELTEPQKQPTKSEGTPKNCFPTIVFPQLMAEQGYLLFVNGTVKNILHGLFINSKEKRILMAIIVPNDDENKSTTCIISGMKYDEMNPEAVKKLFIENTKTGA